jgi:hypothetical protein
MGSTKQELWPNCRSAIVSSRDTTGAHKKRAAALQKEIAKLGGRFKTQRDR